jgi:hypothetical protein
VSFAVFLLMTAGIAYRPVLSMLSLAASALVIANPPKLAKPRVPRWALAAFAGYGMLYAWSASGPEIQADPNTYHLEPAREALAHGGFSAEISFFERLPHALELLFVIAFPFGGAPAARLVHFAFLIATVPLTAALGRRLGLPDFASWGAAALYFLSPVAAVTGTSAFNDAALVCVTLAMLVVLLDDGPAWLAGLLAGLCYAVKMTGGLAVPVGLLVLAGRKRWRDMAPFGLAALVIIAPWPVRNVLQTGNPLAPLFNAWFPNPYFHIATEHQISAALRNYGVPFIQRFPELLWGSKLQGIIGPVFVLAPLAVVSLRRRPGIILITLAVIFSVPWWLNAGARFLMVPLPLIALAMTASLPRPAVIAVMVVHAATALPPVIRKYSPQAWILPGRVNLDHSADYLIAKMVEANTSADDRILDVHGVHVAHVNRRFTPSWQSAQAEVLMRALEFAKLPGQQQLYEWRAEFAEQPLTAVRIRQTGSMSTVWSIVELEFYQDDLRIPNRTRWSLDAEPNRWETPLAVDRNYATRWMTWQLARPDQWLAVDFEGTERLTSVAVVCTIWDGLLPQLVELRNPNGSWHSAPATSTLLPAIDIRKDAVRKLQRAGFRYVVVSGDWAAAMLPNPDAWGLELAGSQHGVHLFRVRL